MNDSLLAAVAAAAGPALPLPAAVTVPVSAAPAPDALAAARSEGVVAERKRIAGILGHAQANVYADFARHLAFETCTSSAEACALLDRLPAAASSVRSAEAANESLRALAAVAPSAVLGAAPPAPDGKVSERAAHDACWDRVLRRVNG